MRQNIQVTKKGILSKERPGVIEFSLLLLLFRLILDYSYSEVISKAYAYMGFSNNYSTGFSILSWIILVMGAALIYHAYENDNGKISKEILFFLYLMSFVPFTSMIRFGVFNVFFIICNSLYWILLLLLNTDLIKISNTHFRITIGNVKMVGDKQLTVIAVIFAIVVLYVSGRYANFRLNFNLLDVYDYRAESKVNELPTIILYLFTWSRTLNSILVAYFIRRKKYIWVVLCVVIQLLSFGYDGSKSTFFLLILAVAVNFLPRFSLRVLNKWAFRGVVLSIGICALLYAISSNIIPISMLTRRVFFLPVRISKDYFDFFTHNQPDYFRQSFLRFFGFESPYSSIPLMVGQIYFNAPSMNANNGLISDAITNLGYTGVVVFPIFTSLILRLLDRTSKGIDPRIYITVSVYISLALTNSFLFTVLLTHGLIATILMLGMMNRQEDIYYDNE